jgi:pimeloyl-ACP methyl ester carboxylesterase
VVGELHPRYTCASLDLRGHGDSETLGSTDLDRLAKDLAQWIGMFADRKRILVAHSMAGRVTLLAHEKFGARFDLLVMADTPLARRPHHFKPEPPFVNKRYPTKEFAVRRFRLLPPGTSADPELILYIAEHALRQNEDGTWSWKFSDAGTSRPFGLKMPDWSELDIESITCPTLLIYGEHSLLVDAEDARETARRFPRGKAVALEGAYHHLLLDRPRAFCRELLKFFRENSL